MLEKIAIALAVIVGVTSGAAAATKGQEVGVWGPYDSQGNYLGAGPDPRDAAVAHRESPDYLIRASDPHGRPRE
jgi:hypothetical protein